MLRVYFADVSDISISYDTSVFSAYRLAKLEKLRSEQKIRQSIGAELLLIHAVKQFLPDVVLPLEIGCDANLKPYFKNIALHFSLSHSGDYAACAISDESLGIDIEHKLKYNERLARRFFSEDEQALLEACRNKDCEFARIWTAKESILKFWGIGLQKKLSDLDICNNKDYSIYHNVIDDVSVSLCTEERHDFMNIEKLIL